MMLSSEAAKCIVVGATSHQPIRALRLRCDDVGKVEAMLKDCVASHGMFIIVTMKVCVCVGVWVLWGCGVWVCVCVCGCVVVWLFVCLVDCSSYFFPH